MFVNVSATRLYFDVQGGGLVPDGPGMRAKPTLVLLHGGPGFDHTMFKPAFSALADLAQVVYLDQRGNGRSARGDLDTWTLARWGDDVKDFCGVLGIERPIVFGGSFGGFVAQSYATRHPDHPAGLILASTAARVDYAAVFDAFERIGGRRAREVAVAYWTDPTPERRRRYFEVCLPLYRRHPAGDPDALKRGIANPDVAFRFNGPANEHGRMDFRAALGRIRCPVLILAGDQAPVTPMPFSETTAACLPPHLVRFAGCGHGVPFEDPERAFGVMREFIAACHDARAP